MKALNHYKFALPFTLLIIVFAGCTSQEKRTPREIASVDTGNQRMELQDLPILKSENGVLDVLMVAKAEPIRSMPGFTPMGWVYEICPRPANGSNECPQRMANAYGGTNLNLQPGDLLKIRLVNQLPPIADSSHALEEGHTFLSLNPTNLHTHGMLVSPRNASASDPTYGDNAFAVVYKKTVTIPQSPHHHGDTKSDFIDYKIQIPKNHPSGNYWFHPHVHGISLNQVSAGMAGIITVGQIEDYLCHGPDCRSSHSKIPVRQLLLKDSQVLNNSILKDEEEPEFCSPLNDGNEPSRLGFCSGKRAEKSEAGSTEKEDFSGGKWFFSINGQVYPKISVNSSTGEIWRITNASASVSYDLRLQLQDTAKNFVPNRDMVIQVISIDGVSLDAKVNIQPKEKRHRFISKFLRSLTRHKFKSVKCPQADEGEDAPLCINGLSMMPSSRVELWVTYRNDQGQLAHPPVGAKGVLRTIGYQSGPDGDSWPAVDLAEVQFADSQPNEQLKFSYMKVKSTKKDAMDPIALAADLTSANRAFTKKSNCSPLKNGHQRRIFFGTPPGNDDAFGLGYEEIDEKGQPVPGTFHDIQQFSTHGSPVCLPLGPGNIPVKERWQLINISGENHNFHIHQTKFQVIDSPDSGNAVDSGGHRALHDNIPLIHADKGTGDSCKSIEDWRRGVCVAQPTTVEIPFFIAGEFPYHCHILEHEDGGMMAVVRVVQGK